MTSNEALDLTTKRIHEDPGLPHPNPTLSHWQLPPHNLSTIQSPTLASETDILILGSGITCCSIAKHLLALTPDSSSIITILEARTLCSGATGKNGGHIATHPVSDYSELVDGLGKQEAAKILRFRLAHYGMIHGEMERLGKEALEYSEVREVESCVGLLSEKKVEEMKRALVGLEEDLPEHKGRVKIYSKSDPEFKNYRMSGVAGLSVEHNGAIWPYRMITTLFAHLLSTYPSRLKIETQTPALSISHDPTSTHPYAITTPRGTIHTKQLIHATNGHTGHLLPLLRGRIFPCKGHMTVQIPGPLFPIPTPDTITTDPNHIPHRSWSFVFDTFGLDYITQNPSTHELWYGGGLIRGADRGLSAFGDVDDSSLDPGVRIHLQNSGRKFFGEENWGSEEGEKEGVKAEWSGIMGFTADELALVGRLPESATGRGGDGEFIAAGFNGYGMPNCWGSGKALAEILVLGKASDEFPESYLVSEYRLDNMDGGDAVRGFLGLDISSK